MNTPYKQRVTVDEILEYFDYDPLTGVIFWKKKPSRNVVVGMVAGGKTFPQGSHVAYIRITFFGKYLFGHNVAFVCMEKRFPQNEVDHQNGVGIDNRWDNLKEATHQENNRNMKLNKRNKTGHTGVFFDKRFNKFTVTVFQKYVGSFGILDDAIQARKEASEPHGFNINHGRVSNG